MVITPSNFSGSSSATATYNTNSRRWGTSLEQDFKTYIKIGSSSYIVADTNDPTGADSTNKLTQETQKITTSMLNSMLTTSERSSASLSTSVVMKRTNVSSGVEATTNKSISVQYQPKYTCTNLKFYNNSTGVEIAPGTTIFLDECPVVKVSWTYPDKEDGGVISGYVVTVYKDSGYSSSVSSFTVSTSELSASQLVTSRTQMNRGYLNYITVTPFYEKPDGTGKLYGTAIKSSFVLPIGKLYPPSVPYPVNGSTWHNTQYRILCQLPLDDDYDVLATEISNGTYRYKEIEVVINGTTYTLTSNPNIFSTVTLGYRTKLCINPSLLSLYPTSSSYTIKIRVQKNYFINLWSDYTTTKVNVKAVNNLNLIQYEPVMADEYTYVRDASVRLYNTYPISSLNSNNIVRKRGDVIYHINYDGIYKTIKQIQEDVNTWAVYDSNKFKCKFNETIDYLDGSDCTKQEFITAAKDARPNMQGRNYMNICIDSMNLLK